MGARPRCRMRVGMLPNMNALRSLPACAGRALCRSRRPRARVCAPRAGARVHCPLPSSSCSAHVAAPPVRPCDCRLSVPGPQGTMALLDLRQLHPDAYAAAAGSSSSSAPGCTTSGPWLK